jgi:NAD(P)-dependent dehydrogenase (short-subunit alcohol dehydrogenase family)
MAAWSPLDIPDLSGRTALVTGATDGLGLETARMLAARHAKVILAGRNAEKGRRALERIRRESPAAEIAFEPVELGDLSTVRSLAQRLSHAPLDILVNNAGVMGLPRGTTAQGFETHLGVNYLGHFVLTGGLLPALRAARAPRVVSLSSIAHRAARIDFDDLQGERSYSPWRAYGQSKLAMLLFAQELQRRSDAHGWGLLSVAAHPGFARTNLLNAPGGSRLAARGAALLGPIFGHDAREGALPQVLAATATEVAPGSYWGPSRLMEMKGPPGPASPAPQGRDPQVASRLWDLSQRLTDHPFGDGA